jgi:putative membrane protein
LRRALSLLTRPLLVLAVFNGVLVLTHLPVVVDNFRGTQVGGFGIDMLWLCSGLLMWWVVLAPLPEFNRLHPFWAIGFLFLQSLVPTVPASFLTFADYPLYGLYELAPRIGDISATEDQQLAGLLMKIGGAIILWSAIAVIFFRWYVEDEEAKRPARVDEETTLEPRALDAEPELAATGRGSSLRL